MRKLKPILTGRIILALTALVLGLIVFFSLNSAKYSLSDSPKNEINLKIGSAQITAEVAQTPESIIQGLSERKSLEENSGMYFVLGEKKIATFWMKDMLFSLDIIWIDNGKIVGINENVSVPTNDIIPTYTSTQPVTHVLEVNAGFASKHNIEVGSTVEATN